MKMFFQKIYVFVQLSVFSSLGFPQEKFSPHSDSEKSIERNAKANYLNRKVAMNPGIKTKARKEEKLHYKILI